MRAVGVDNLRPGLVVGRPVLDDQGRPLLNSGVVLNEEYIRGLVAKGFDRIYVRDPGSSFDAPPDEDLDPATRSRAFQALQHTMNEIEDCLGDARREGFEDIRKACGSDAFRALMSGSGPLAKLSEAVDAILDEVLTHRTLAGLVSIRSANTKMLEHAIDVCVISIMIGHAVNVSARHLKPLAAGALLHDIGHVFLDETVSCDPARRVRQHTLLGYEILKLGDNPDILAPHVALEHHEHQDGTGEPRGLVGSNRIERDRANPPPIPALVGEIAAVANRYDVMTSGLWGDPPLPPDEAIALIHRAAGTELNKAVVAAFTRVVPVYPKGLEVVVRSEAYYNFSGVVAEVHADRLDRPVVVLTRDNRNQDISPLRIDLAEESGIVIRSRGA